MVIQVVRIPEERVAVLIGKNGSTKRMIIKKTKCNINIAENEVMIRGDAINALTAENVVKAIGRGFSPKTGLKLLKEENTLIILNLPKSPKALQRLKSRIIGTRGKCRNNIERLTGTCISVYGRTVAIIGGYDEAEKSAEAIRKIIHGAAHKNVYGFLEKKTEKRIIEPGMD
ncbi:MAG: RNA-processing protein [Candidatus Aenigmarchaeota archaeon]|nr:RNA-processing protein [Candidatus Aenigmarchaeota archaeon]